MKKTILFSFQFFGAIIFFIQCTKDPEWHVHKYHGAWEIEKIEYCRRDSLTQSFKLDTTYYNCGRFYLYDQCMDEDNELFYYMYGSAKCLGIEVIKMYCDETDGCIYWYMDEDRFDMWEKRYGYFLTGYHVIYTIEKKKKNYLIMQYVYNNDEKEILYLRRYK